MSKEEKLDSFFGSSSPYQEAMATLRNILLKTELEETYKWQFPVYTIDGKNIVGLGAFKAHFGVWFFQGALLSDPANKLINAQEGKTTAMRQWRMESDEEIDEKLLLEYVEEAIANQRAGRVIKPARSGQKMPLISPELSEFFAESQAVKQAFDRLTPGKQREFIEYVKEAKRASTKKSRIEKISVMILEGRGLNDKYR